MESLRRFVLSEQFETDIERVRRICLMKVGSMRCPHHFADAKIEIDSAVPNLFQIEVITCCEEFERQVCDTLRDHPDAAGDGFLYVVDGFKDPKAA